MFCSNRGGGNSEYTKQYMARMNGEGGGGVASGTLIEPYQAGMRPYIY